MRACVALAVVLGAGCAHATSIEAAHAIAPVAAWRGDPRAVAATPTDDALAAREARLSSGLSELGPDETRALVESTLAWLAWLADSGGLERLRTSCVAVVACEQGDVIADLSGACTVEETSRREAEQARCAHDERVVRAIEWTRDHLEAESSVPGALAPLRMAIAERSETGHACGASPRDEVLYAALVHALEMRIHPVQPDTASLACALVPTLGGAVAVDPATSVRAVVELHDEHAVVEIVLDSPCSTDAMIVESELRHMLGEWRVIASSVGWAEVAQTASCDDWLRAR